MFADDLKLLKTLLSSSGGTPIDLPSGGRGAFKRTRSISPAELDGLEKKMGRPLPVSYRQLLGQIGACELFVTAAGGLEVLDPFGIQQRFGEFFEESEVDLKRFLPVAIDERLQEIVVFALDRKRDRNLLVMPHDTSPEDWEDDADEMEVWSTLEDWIAEAVALEGNMEPH